MHDFVFELPVKIRFGNGILGEMGREARKYGRRVLFVTGCSSLRKSGRYDDIMDALSEAGLTVTEFSGIRANPDIQTVRKAITLARQERIELIAAVGGGSVIDSAKAVAAGIPATHDVWKFFKGKKGVGKCLPVVCAPTLAAAGSELNGGMVLTDNLSGQKIGIGNKKLIPKVCLLDPLTTMSVSDKQSAYGAVDAFTHAFEYYFNASLSTGVQLRLLEGLMASLMETSRTLHQSSGDKIARAQQLWSASLALCGMFSAGLGRVDFPLHMISHALSGRYDYSHGAALAALLSGWLQWLDLSEKGQRMIDLAKNVFKEDPPNPEEARKVVLNKLKEWFNQLQCPVGLSDLGVKENELGEIARHCQPQAKLWRLRQYSEPVIIDILKHAAAMRV